jgi:hypothetical protein
MPADDGLCLGPVGENFASGCAYGDRLCDCVEGRWRCGACPRNIPANGAACAFVANCSYTTGFCYCDGAKWICS